MQGATLGILKLPGDHLLEIVTWEKDDAHVVERHLHIGLNAVPISSETECLCVEIDSRFIVAGEKPHGVEFEFIHCYFTLGIFCFYSRPVAPCNKGRNER